MSWYHQKPRVTKDFDELTKTYNEKYGHYDYKQDSRSLDSTFEKTFLTAVGDISNLNVLVCGANSGYEIKILAPLFPNSKFTAVDISTEALNGLAAALPKVTRTHADMEVLPFNDKQFDLYLNCRAIHSTDVNMEIAINEAIRVTKGKIVLSASNGYRVADALVNGMYDYDLKSIDKDKPKKIITQLRQMLVNNKYSVTEQSSKAELFLVALPELVA